MSKLLFCMGEGIGNIIQTIPAVRTLTESMGFSVDYWHAFGSFKVPKIIPYVENWYVGNELRYVNLKQYLGLVVTPWTVSHVSRISLPKVNKPLPFSMDKYSEIYVYMQAAKDLGAKEENLIWHGTCMYEDVEESYDVVIMDGYNPLGSANWQIKSYPYYEEVAKLLMERGLSVCSIGSKEERVKGTVNETGRPLLESFGVVKNSKLLLSNDTGMYHAANALSTKNITVFTATSTIKNYDPRFHKYSKLVFREDLPCRPCQEQRRWLKDCKTWDCREVSPHKISAAVLETLYE